MKLLRAFFEAISFVALILLVVLFIVFVPIIIAKQINPDGYEPYAIVGMVFLFLVMVFTVMFYPKKKS